MSTPAPSSSSSSATPIRHSVATGSSPFVPPSAHSFAFHARRSPVISLHGSIACSQPLAAQAGLKLLEQGANAAEVCITIAAALNVLEPSSTGIGGDCFAIFFDAATGKVDGLNGSGRSPKELSQDKLKPEDKNRAGDGMAPLSAHCVTVPGAAAGWEDCVRRWGSGKFSMLQLLTPAIQMAEQGVPIAPLSAEAWARSEKLLAKTNEASDSNPCVMLPNGHAPAAGEIFKNPDLATTFRVLAEEGAAGFYSGRIGRSIVESLRSRGGLMSLEDLTEHRSTFPAPISVKYKGVDVFEIPPNGQGLTALLALNMLQSLENQAAEAKSNVQPIAELGHNSAAYLHRVVECMRLAFADTRYYVADADHADSLGDDQGAKAKRTLEALLSSEYAAERIKRLDHSITNLNHPYGSPVNSSSTVSFCVVDSKGNACSFINSNYMGFGSAIVPKGCGFTLQNRGANFTLDSSIAPSRDLDAQGRHPNRLMGGKRPYHTIIPGLALKDGKLYCPFSVMGGFNQPQGHVQVLLNLIEFGMDPQAAIDAPRFCIESGLHSGEVLLEDGITKETAQKMEKMGHVVRLVSGYERVVFGRGQIIRRMENGVLWAGSDGRGDGCAVGY